MGCANSSETEPSLKLSAPLELEHSPPQSIPRSHIQNANAAEDFSEPINPFRAVDTVSSNDNDGASRSSPGSPSFAVRPMVSQAGLQLESASGYHDCAQPRGRSTSVRSATTAYAGSAREGTSSPGRLTAASFRGSAPQLSDEYFPSQQPSRQQSPGARRLSNTDRAAKNRAATAAWERTTHNLSASSSFNNGSTMLTPSVAPILPAEDTGANGEQSTPMTNQFNSSLDRPLTSGKPPRPPSLSNLQSLTPCGSAKLRSPLSATVRRLSQ